jgi:hypothetical protein
LPLEAFELCRGGIAPRRAQQGRCSLKIIPPTEDFRQERFRERFLRLNLKSLGEPLLRVIQALREQSDVAQTKDRLEIPGIFGDDA